MLPLHIPMAGKVITLRTQIIVKLEGCVIHMSIISRLYLSNQLTLDIKQIFIYRSLFLSGICCIDSKLAPPPSPLAFNRQ
jgi:hypothetical protein